MLRKAEICYLNNCLCSDDDCVGGLEPAVNGRPMYSEYLLLNIYGNTELYGRNFTPNLGLTVSPALSATKMIFRKLKQKYP